MVFKMSQSTMSFTEILFGILFFWIICISRKPLTLGCIMCSFNDKILIVDNWNTVRWINCFDHFVLNFRNIYSTPTYKLNTEYTGCFTAITFILFCSNISIVNIYEIITEQAQFSSDNDIHKFQPITEMAIDSAPLPKFYQGHYCFRDLGENLEEVHC